MRAGHQAGGGSARLPAGLRPVTALTRVTTAELFFDLVFVFAFIQVTSLVTENPSALGLARGLLVLAVLWWSWSLFAWLGNRIRANYGITRLVLLAATPIMFVLAATIREAFDDFPGGLDGPVVFAAGYTALRLLHLALHWYATPGMTARAALALVVPMVGAAVLLFAAAVAPQHVFDRPRAVDLAQLGCWVLAVLVDYSAGLALPARDRQVFAARHWTERHGLIMIAAIGEALIAIGLGGSDLATSWELIGASVLAVVVAGALEWTYFDVAALAGEQSMQQATPEHRATLARDAYSYLHLPMIAGIILLALGLKKMPAFVDPTLRHPNTRLPSLGVWSLYGGAALFLLGHVAFQLRITHLIRTIIRPRLVTALLLVALVPAAMMLPALWALGLLAASGLGLVLVEIVVADGQRRRLRESAQAEESGPGGEPAGPTS
ncbi:low temperature requirement protein A [Micromonospora sp. NBC_01699]|uniref:low temperature requirement protein A n=1 Tax=Micromonospora sp. NBC_01699 TaxID=2975984 RepID=UPI002E288F67|nr:low temperature requirement protein A [Micromonospora sp. NBC_01699]